MGKTGRILIVGAGPVGAITGLRLAQHGFDVTLFDQNITAPDDHRASTLQPASHEIFAKVGIIDEIERQGIRAPLYQWRDRLLEEVIADFDYGILKDVTDFPYVIQLEQHKTINIALAAGANYPNFTLIRPVEVIAVSQTADGVTADIKREDGSVETFSGTYLVGCDGGRSMVRKSIGMSFEGFTWDARQLVITTNYDFKAAMNFRYRNYYIHPKRSCSVFKVPGDDERGFWRCVFAVKPEETEEEVMSEEWINARFVECLPIGMPYPILHKNLYTTHNRVADKFYDGRIALAGDAAHLNNPNGGMGMNSGFQDGMNIADKLKEIREGGDPEALLSRYDRQRRETTLQFVQPQSIAGKQLMLELNLEKRREGMDRLRRIVSEPATHHDYLYKASLLAMQHKADEIV